MPPTKEVDVVLREDVEVRREDKWDGVDIAVRICFVKDMWESWEGEEDGRGVGNGRVCFLERKVLCDGGGGEDEDGFMSKDSKRLSLSIIGDKIIISNYLI